MAAYVLELLDFKYYKSSVDGIKDKAEEILKEQKKEDPDRIPYIVFAKKIILENFYFYIYHEIIVVMSMLYCNT